MLNIDLPYNFNSPYKAKSIGEFWERWHITLTRFFTRYVYIPLGGSRKGKLRTYLNTILVFLLSGLWHGAEWSFVFWGLLHGIFMTVEKIGKDLGLGGGKVKGSFRKILEGCRWLLTFGLVNIAWVFFRAGNMENAGAFLRSLCSGGWKCDTRITEVFNDIIEIRMLSRIGLGGILEVNTDVVIWLVLVSLVMLVAFGRNVQEWVSDKKYTWVRSVITMILLVWCIISMSDVSEFLYFNF